MIWNDPMLRKRTPSEPVIPPGSDLVAMDSNGRVFVPDVSYPSNTITVREAAEVIRSSEPGVEAENLTVVWVHDINEYISSGEYLTIYFDVLGATVDDIVYILLFGESGWVCLAKCKGADVSAKFTELSTVALVLQKGSSVGPKPGPGDETPKP